MSSRTRSGTLRADAVIIDVIAVFEVVLVLHQLLFELDVVLELAVEVGIIIRRGLIRRAVVFIGNAQVGSRFIQIFDAIDYLHRTVEALELVGASWQRKRGKANRQGQYPDDQLVFAHANAPSGAAQILSWNSR